jgi:hypothetical protein
MGMANGPSAMRGRNSLTNKLKYGASMLALGALVIGSPAMAQTAAKTDAQTVDEVIVTERSGRAPKTSAPCRTAR